MKQPTVLIVFGTRPEAIKMAPVVAELGRAPQMKVKVCATGQHRQMLDQVLDLFAIRPDHDLNLMRAGQDLSDITAGVVTGMREVLAQTRPDIVLVHGDTTTAMGAALAAFYARVPVGHVEAGLRTRNIYSPWPEEMNRRLIGQLATLHFAPTDRSAQNLLAEGHRSEDVVVTGNTVIDALLDVVRRFEQQPAVSAALERQFPFLGSGRRVVLVTGHRRENFGSGFESICQGLKQIASRGDVEVVYPVHLNPKVREPVQRLLSNDTRIHLIEPLEYLPFTYLMKRSSLVLTDSGGIQEEAPSLGKPVLVMRDNTERPEAVDAGTVKLVGTDAERIVHWTNALLDDRELYRTMAEAHNPYGDGQASARIREVLERRFVQPGAGPEAA